MIPQSLLNIHLRKHSLDGYSLSLDKKSRRAILYKLSKIDGWGTIVKKLNILRIFNKNNHPDIYDKISRDIKYVHTLKPVPILKRSLIKRKSNRKRISLKKSLTKDRKKKVSLKKSSTKIPKKRSLQY